MPSLPVKPVVYLPGLPNLSSDDIDLWDDITAARSNLIRKLNQNFTVKQIDSRNRPWLKTMLETAEASHAFIFPPTPLPEQHPNFHLEAAQRWFEFFSLVTGIHIGNHAEYNPEGVSKPCIVIPDQVYALAIDLLKDLHEKKMFSSEVEDIVHVVSAGPNQQNFEAQNEAAVQALKTVLGKGKGKLKIDVKPEYPQDYVFTPFLKDINRNRFGVALFGSATTAEPIYLRAAHDLGKKIGERGWRMVTGAGKNGCMGAADAGFEEGKNIFNRLHPNTKYKPAHIGVSTQAILRLEGPPPYLDQLIITDDIYQRMEVMIHGQRTVEKYTGRILGDSEEDFQLRGMLRARDAVRVIFVTPGGTGTLHEFATLMQLTTNGNMMKDRKTVLLNSPSHLNPSQRFWTPLIETAKKLGFRNLFEIAETPDEAIKIADKEYEKWLDRQTDAEHQSIPHPHLNPVKPTPAS